MSKWQQSNNILKLWSEHLQRSLTGHLSRLHQCQKVQAASTSSLSFWGSWTYVTLIWSFWFLESSYWPGQHNEASSDLCLTLRNPIDTLGFYLNLHLPACAPIDVIYWTQQLGPRGFCLHPTARMCLRNGYSHATFTANETRWSSLDVRFIFHCVPPLAWGQLQQLITSNPIFFFHGYITSAQTSVTSAEDYLEAGPSNGLSAMWNQLF